MKTLHKIAAAAVFTLAPLNAIAATGNVDFNGAVTHTCSINVTQAGSLGASTDFSNLSDSNSGGQSGAATINATGNGFDLFVDAPTNFAGPTSADTIVASISGGLSDTSGTAAGADVPHGGANVDVHLSASKTSGVFEAGAYSATVVLRCE